MIILTMIIVIMHDLTTKTHLGTRKDIHHTPISKHNNKVVESFE